MTQTLTFIFCCLIWQSAWAEDNKVSLTVGIVPQQSAQKLASTWGPILAKASEYADLELVFATAKDIPSFEKNIADGLYDIAYMNPYHYVVFSEKPGYRALLKQQEKKIRGIVVARKDAAYQTLDDLNNTSIAFPAPAAFAATIIPQSELASREIKYTPRYVSSHDSVYINVARGFMDSGGGIERTLAALPETTRAQLKIIWKSDAFTPHAIATHPKLSDKTVRRLSDAFLKLNHPQHKALLAKLKFKGFTKAHDKDWNDVRKLSISHKLNE